MRRPASRNNGGFFTEGHVYLKLFADSPHQEKILAGIILLTAFVSHFQAFNSWWCLDDWGQLARAAGIVPGADGFPARWLSQHVWWNLTWPLFRLNADAQTFLRILIHGLSSVLVFRIGRRCRLPVTASFFGGLLFANTPFAFTPVFWASGIQELLGGFFALFSLERWLGKSSRWNISLAGLLAVLSILAKESGLGLPLVFGGLLLFRWPRSGSHPVYRWVVTATVTAFVVFEVILVTNHFATGTGETYATGGVLIILTSLGKYGWWLGVFNPIFTSNFSTAMVVSGWAFFLIWGGWGLYALRRRSYFPLAAFVWAVLSLGPALPLVYQPHPYLAYLAVPAFYLTFGDLLLRRIGHPRKVLPVLALLVVGWGTWGLQHRLDLTNSRGYPADPVVRASRLSRAAARGLLAVRDIDQQAGSPGVYVLQPPNSSADAERAERMGPDFVLRTSRFAALEGTVGLQLIIGPGTEVGWINNLLTIKSNSRVFCETGPGILDWGMCWDALFYTAISDVWLGHYDRARRHLLRARAIDPDFFRFEFKTELCPGPIEVFAGKSQGYIDWLHGLESAGTVSRKDAQVLEDMFLAFKAEVVGP